MSDRFDSKYSDSSRPNRSMPRSAFLTAGARLLMRWHLELGREVYVDKWPDETEGYARYQQVLETLAEADPGDPEVQYKVARHQKSGDLEWAYAEVIPTDWWDLLRKQYEQPFDYFKTLGELAQAMDDALRPTFTRSAGIGLAYALAYTAASASDRPLEYPDPILLFAGCLTPHQDSSPGNTTRTLFAIINELKPNEGEQPVYQLLALDKRYGIPSEPDPDLERLEQTSYFGEECERVFRAASHIAEQVRGDPQIHRHHLLVALLRPAPALPLHRFLEELGISLVELRERFLEYLTRQFSVIEEVGAYAQWLPRGGARQSDRKGRPGSARSRVFCDYLSDSADTAGRQDLLDVDKDARAIARLVCAHEADPPLSIGLFGDWGSGKSFAPMR